MSSIIDRSLARSVELLGDMIDSQRQEIESYKNEIERMRSVCKHLNDKRTVNTQSEIIKLKATISQMKVEQNIHANVLPRLKQDCRELRSENGELKKELEFYKHMVATLEDKLLQAGVAPATTSS